MTADIPDLVHQAIEGIADVKGENTTLLDMRHLDNAVADFFIIAEAQSTTQVSAMAGSVEKTCRESLGEKPWHREGLANATWILLDYVKVVVHLFQRESREFYDIEGLWGDAEMTQFNHGGES